MSHEDIISKLHPLERKVLPLLEQGISFDTLLAKATSMKEIELMRALQWLENKKVIDLKVDIKEVVDLDENGKNYLAEGLPERRLLSQVKKNTKVADIDITKDELSAALGILRKKAAITIEKKSEGLFLSITPAGEKSLQKESLEESFLKKLPIELKDLKDEDKFALESLKQRKRIIKTDIRKIRTIFLTSVGKEIILKDLKKVSSSIDRLDPAMLQTSSWKNKSFRKFDVSINVPKIIAGRRQPYLEFLNDIKRKLVGLGFKEMTGPLIESEFYNFDVLFQPQNHPARTWTDTYHLKYPTHGILPDKKIVNAVKSAHENGGSTGSTGWHYNWNPEIAKQLMPRAHGTALSGRQMAKGIKIPAKYFGIARCYRPDVLDATHLIEFNQMEGFVADDTINFKTLLGMLKQFAIEIAGATEVRFYPDYYPFTEPSVQISAKHPKLGWIELGGAGIFRPELTEALGIKVPVMAWGLGIDRLAMFKLGINDIRYLFSSDLKWLREVKLV
ncbi:phenylalanine--tRNA ligase subunit alpha [Candidatus Woesearchaeota archaeon]|nr:phenylalanine--tRNA ligase subunit alpha [Candidatus Woesearchaeota archaeon]